MSKISCIIPAYNEEERIGKVLDVVSVHPLIDEIIVIDDASTDGTKNIVDKYEKAHYIVNEKNSGKSFSVAKGIEASNGEFIFMLDADLVGITAEDITHMIAPVLSGSADISISLRRNSPFVWRLIGLDYISGERVLPRALFSPGVLGGLKQLSKFGIEVFLNNFIIKNKYKIKIVQMNTVDSPFKYKKYGMWKGVKGEAGMFRDMFTTISPLRAVFQIYTMIKLSI